MSASVTQRRLIGLFLQSTRISIS